jgi:hypothetical protein
LSDAEANEFISAALGRPEPLLVARFGSVELEALLLFEHLRGLNLLGRWYDFSQRGAYAFTRRAFHQLHFNAGFFPINRSQLERFHQTMLEAMPEVDLLASWVKGETRYRAQLAAAAVCHLPSIEPYYHENPWSAQLAGRKVLVIHPFARTIERQYQRARHGLFPNTTVLPDFDLQCLPAVQAIAGNQTPFATWFEALDWMTDDALRRDFEVAILGCGAFGFPLAARIKAAGRKAIHLGGATQILFGIKGRRWEQMPRVSALFNEHWVRPAAHEAVTQKERVEGACYW